MGHSLLLDCSGQRQVSGMPARRLANRSAACNLDDGVVKLNSDCELVKNFVAYTNTNVGQVRASASEFPSVSVALEQDGIQVPGWKRVLDCSIILFTLPFTIPLGCLIAALIKIVSRGPVFFHQKRVGYECRPFICFKFRTMKKDCDQGGHQSHLTELIYADVPMTKMDAKGDRRLIPFGKFLRSTGLDELPQLINVWHGDMSIVGPRPCTVYEFENYLPWHRERFTTLPGLTGLWQVSGKNKTTFTQMMNLDIKYARSKTLTMDLSIMARTFGVLLSQTWEMFVARMRNQRQSTPTQHHEERHQNWRRRLRLLGA